ncbi:unnamed protein product, partial [Brassica oleracea]
MALIQMPSTSPSMCRSVGEISAINRLGVFSDLKTGSVHRLWRLGTIGLFLRAAIRLSCSSSSLRMNHVRIALALRFV